MADQTILSAPVGTGDTIRTVDKTTYKTPVSLIDIGGSGAESLVTTANPLPISDAGGSLTVDGSLTTVSTVTSLTQMNGAAISMGTGVRGTGTQRVTICTDDVVPASQSGTWTVQPGNTANTTAWITQPVAGTTGGATPVQVLTTASTNATSIKASAGTLYTISAINTTATIYYLKFYNVSGTPSPGSDTPLQTFPIPANTSAAGLTIAFPVGIAFGTGIGICVVGAIGATDTSNAATGVAVSLTYK